MLRPALVLAAAALAIVVWPSPSRAAPLAFNATLKGVSETYTGEKFKFTGTGTMTFDDAANTVTYSFALSNGFTFSGTGMGAVTPKGRIFGVVNTVSNQIMGSAVVEGKTSKENTKFTVKITAAIPNRLGDPPQGFVLAKMTAKGTRQS